jgi:eukaryotic-like serine/threonine-protein kinase
MAIKLTPESFLNVVKQSNLVTGDVLKRLMTDLQAEGVEVDSRVIADELVERALLTRWQADKLLQGKHKGFFLGKYRLLKLLGKGGMSSVYLAEHVLMRRQCAIKVLPTKRVNDTSYLGRFHREAQAVASLDHPNIIKAYDVDKEMEKDTEIHFLVMEFVDGRSLQELVQQEGPLGFERAADFIRQSAEGLAHAHQAGMVHRDIKPGNLLIDRNDVVKLLDMGLARFFHEGEEESLTVAHDEKVLGTADYLAPEQALDSHSVDARADIYSLGCTFYFLLTGHPPFTEGTLAQRLMSHQTKTPPPVTGDRPDIPPGLLAILEKMMAKKREERYQTAAEVANDLADWLVENASEEWRQANPGLSGSGKSSSGVRDNGSAAAKPAVPFAKAVANETDTSPDRAETGFNAEPAEPDAGNELSDFLAHLGSSETGGSGKSGSRKDSAVKKADQAQPVAAPVQTDPDKPARRSRPTGSAKPAKPVSDSTRDGSGSRAAKPAVPVAAGVADRPVPRPVKEEIPEQKNEYAIDTSSEGVSPTQVTSRSKQLRAVKETSADWKDRLKDKRILAALGGVVVLLLGLGIYAIVSNLGDPSDRKELVEPENGDGAGDPDQTDLLGKPILVGPKGSFKTLKEALDFVKREFDDLGAKEPQVITLAAGEVFEERIHLDNSFGSENKSPNKIHITTDASNPAILRPPGPDPVIQLIDGITDVQIQNLHVDATGKDTAVYLLGGLENSKLMGLRIAGYAKTGIAGDSVFGGNKLERDGKPRPLVIENSTFQGASGDTIGIHLEEANTFSDLQQIVIRDCQFLSPMKAGLELNTGTQGQDAVKNVQIVGNIFASDGGGVGILFTGKPSLEKLLIANNTFYKLNQGLAFAEFPAKLTSVGVQRNLFADIKSQEAVVQKGDANQFPKGWVLDANATTGDKTKPGDKKELKLFARTRNSKAGLKITFASVDSGKRELSRPHERGRPSQTG